MEAWYVILAIAIAIGVFFLCRELNCWYLKINARMDLMENMLRNQKEIIRLLKNQNGEVLVAPSEVAKPEEKTNSEEIKVGSVVTSLVEKYDVPANTKLVVEMIWMDTYHCSLNGTRIGTYLKSEVK